MLNIQDPKASRIMPIFRVSNPDYVRFGQLFKDVNESSAEPRSYETLDIPCAIGERSDLVKRLLALFEQEWKLRESKHVQRNAFQETDVPESGREYPDDIYPADLDEIFEAVAQVMPSPADPEFTDFMSCRIHGVFEAMRLLVKLHNKTADTNVVIEEARQLAADIVGSEGEIFEIDSAPIELRRAETAKRIARLRSLADGETYVIGVNWIPASLQPQQ